MNKETLLHQIAVTGYNSGFGAKVCFSSYDILRFGPGLIAFLLGCVGTMGLVLDELSTKTVSALALCIGGLSFYLNPTEKRLNTLAKSGSALTKVRNDAAILHGRVLAMPISSDFSDEIVRLEAIRDELSKATESQQLMFSGWLGHYKFFGEAQIQWIEQELKLTFWKDKVPASLKLCIYLLFGATLLWVLIELGMWLRVERHLAGLPQ